MQGSHGSEPTDSLPSRTGPPIMAAGVRSQGRPRPYVAGGLALAAALIHFVIAPEHFDESLEAGVFMVLVGAAQSAAGVLFITHPSRALVVATISLTLLVFGVYAVSRTTGLPFRPYIGEPEAIHGIDVLSKATELMLLLVLVAPTGRQWARMRRPQARGRDNPSQADGK